MLNNERFIKSFVEVAGDGEGAEAAFSRLYKFMVRFGYINEVDSDADAFETGLWRVRELLLPRVHVRDVASPNFLRSALKVAATSRCGFIDKDGKRPVLHRLPVDAVDIPHEVTYFFEEGPSVRERECAFNAVRIAMDKWEEVKITLDERQVSVVVFVPSSERDARITVGWKPTVFGTEHDMTGPVVAHATVAAPSPVGVAHFDIGQEEGWSHFGSSTGFDIATIALHELGHCLGLAHIYRPVYPKPAMHPAFDEAERLELAPADTNALIDLYTPLLVRKSMSTHGGGDEVPSE